MGEGDIGGDVVRRFPNLDHHGVRRRQVRPELYSRLSVLVRDPGTPAGVVMAGTLKT